MTFRQFILPFSAGLVVGFLVAKNWTQIQAAVKPVAQRIGARGKQALEIGREKLWEQRERMEDLIAEARQRNTAEARPGSPARA